MKLKLHFLNSLPCVLGFACMLWLMNAISYGNRKQLRISTKILFFSLLKHSVYNIFFTRLSSVPVNSSVTGLEWPNSVCVHFTMSILDKQLLLVTAEKNIVISNHTCMWLGRLFSVKLLNFEDIRYDEYTEKRRIHARLDATTKVRSTTMFAMIYRERQNNCLIL